ncbi:hypothetical protein N9K05_00620 [Woeseiaceae bacterium]|nr:hypothetical protein [Woeseiaceae bacterium]
MTNKTVTHEIKLDKSLKTILWALVIGVMLNAIPQGTLIDDAVADDGHIISRILFCIDGSRISNNKLITYCNS